VEENVGKLLRAKGSCRAWALVSVGEVICLIHPSDIILVLRWHNSHFIVWDLTQQCMYEVFFLDFARMDWEEVTSEGF